MALGFWVAEVMTFNTALSALSNSWIRAHLLFAHLATRQMTPTMITCRSLMNGGRQLLTYAPGFLQQKCVAQRAHTDRVTGCSIIFASVLVRLVVPAQFASNEKKLPMFYSVHSTESSKLRSRHCSLCKFEIRGRKQQL